MRLRQFRITAVLRTGIARLLIAGREGQAVVETSVAQPLEAQIVGADQMLYMKSTSSNDGSYTLTVSFALGVLCSTVPVFGDCTGVRRPTRRSEEDVYCTVINRRLRRSRLRIRQLVQNGQFFAGLIEEPANVLIASQP